MGIQWSTESTNMMKLVICAVLIAAVYADAEPKADADAYLGYTGLTQGVHGVNGVRGLAGLGYAAPYGYAASPYAYGALPYGYGFHGIGKRSADAEPAYPGYLGYGAGLAGFGAGLAGYGYASPYYGSNLAGYRAYPYATYGAYPHHALGKRSADADADAAYRGAYNGYASPFNYGYGYNPITYGYPYRALNTYGHRAYGYGW